MSTNLTIKNEFKVAMTSLQVAEVTGKQHSHVMRDIVDESEKLGKEISESIFQLAEYKGSRRMEKCYNLTRDGAMQLGARYDAVTRYKMIQRINELEAQVKVDSYMIADPVERAKAWIIEQEERIALAIENTEIKQAVVGIKNSLNNLEADVRVNINQAIRRLADVYCKHNKISGMDRECIYREIYQTIYTGFCKEYNIDFKDIKNKEYVSLKTGKPTKTKQSFIKIIESMGYSTMLMEYVIQLKPAEINLIKE
jgi:phage regulator Rha-like protein